MEPYYPFIEGMLNQGILTKEEISGRKILIVGRNTVEGLQHRIEVVMRSFFLSNGAVKCINIGIFNGAGADFVGNVEDIAKIVGEEKFDCVFVTEGLEKTQSFLQAAEAIKYVCAENGKIIIVARTPVETGTKIKVNYYEDYWRYEAEDLIALFDDCIAEATASTEPGYFIAVKFTKPKDFVVKTNRNVAIYNCRLEKKVIYEDGIYNTGYFNRYRELCVIGDETKTDKCRFDHNYLEKYEFFLEKMHDEKFTLLELGVFEGASTTMWRDYFKKANIIGVDLNPACQQYAGERIEIKIMDLASVENLEQLKNVNASVVIDDASHIWSHQIKALFTLFPALPSGGIYILEDLETCVNAEIYPGYADTAIDPYEVCSRIARVVAGKNEWQGDATFKKEIDSIGMQTEMISIIKGSCILIKR